jgi:hypothetical protein
MDAAAKRRIKDTPVLPDELVEEILSYLPAKSLRRFECLSRPWRQVITSPAFQDLHYKRAGRCRNQRLFIRAEGSCESFYAWQPNEDHGTVVEEIMGPIFYLPQGRDLPCHQVLSRVSHPALPPVQHVLRLEPFHEGHLGAS